MKSEPAAPSRCFPDHTAFDPAPDGFLLMRSSDATSAIVARSDPSAVQTSLLQAVRAYARKHQSVESLVTPRFLTISRRLLPISFKSR
jgi:hypothetical protein